MAGTACSYCAIRLATGRLESVPLVKLLNSFQDAARRREPTVMVLGGDTGAYGRDIGTSFPILLGQILQVDNAPRIYVHDLNINWVLKDLSRYSRMLAQGSQGLRAMSIPIQSGSDTVLKRMRRPYDAATVAIGWDALRTAAPHVALGTHIIAGFPGETDDDFSQTLNLLRRIEPDFVTCFRYSAHPRAPAARYADQVPEATKRERLGAFCELLGDRAVILL